MTRARDCGENLMSERFRPRSRWAHSVARRMLVATRIRAILICLEDKSQLVDFEPHATSTTGASVLRRFSCGPARCAAQWSDHRDWGIFHSSAPCECKPSRAWCARHNGACQRDAPVLAVKPHDARARARAYCVEIQPEASVLE